MKPMLIAALVAAVALAGCTDGDDGNKYTVPDQDVQGRYVIPVAPDGQNVFGIRFAEVPVGATVVWVYAGDPNADPHNVKADDARFTSVITQDAFEVEWTFTEEEVFTYHCVPHQSVGMLGEINVVAADDGSGGGTA